MMRDAVLKTVEICLQSNVKVQDANKPLKEEKKEEVEPSKASPARIPLAKAAASLRQAVGEVHSN